MKRIVAIVAALGIVASACGGGDDADATAEQTTAEQTASESATSDATEAATADGESNGEQVPADADGEQSDGGDEGGGQSIRSLDDIPEECRDRMADFLREVEPIVSSIDWETATVADFEQISEEFEVKSDQFEEDFDGAGCDDLDFTDDNEFELMIDFAGDEAPGTVEFLEFLAAAGAAGGGSVGGGATADGALASCDEAVTFVQGLIDDYDSFESVPAADLLKFSSLATVFVTCSPEQLEFFDSPEVNDFLGGE